MKINIYSMVLQKCFNKFFYSSGVDPLPSHQLSHVAVRNEFVAEIFEAEYGGVRAYLLAAGVTEQALQRLEDKLVERA